MKTLSLKKSSLSLANNRLFFVRSLLMALHSFLLVGFIAYQFVQPLFINATTWIWAYLCLFICFVFDFIFFYSHGLQTVGGWAQGLNRNDMFGKAPSAVGGWAQGLNLPKKSKVFGSSYVQGMGVFLDTVLITVCLSMVLPALSSVLLFIYMLSILGAGVLGQYKGAFAQGLLVSFLFSCVLILQPAFAESYPSLVFAFVLNNIGFMAVAGLSGFFGAEALKRDWLIGVGDKANWELENLNRLIVENMDMGLFIVDEDTHIIHSNSQARKLLALPEGFSAPIYRLFPEIREYLISSNPDVHRFQLEYQIDGEAGSAIGAGSVRGADSDRGAGSAIGAGSARGADSDRGVGTKTIEVFISPIKGADFETSQGQKNLILFQDVTQEKEWEKQEREQEKLAGIGRMAMGIAHELRNPLSSVGGSIQLLDLDNNKNKEENKRLMDIALREISRLNGIIGEFLSYTSDESTLENLPTEPVDINTVLEELLDSVRVNPHWDHIKHHALLKAHGLVEGRADKFKQIFWNVVKNGCEAMSHQAEGCLTLETFDDQEWVVVRIKDNGRGISDKDKPFIYEPFYSKKEKGSGLGLAITRKLVLFYKGFISHQPAEKGGTLFEIRFPLQSNPLPSEMARRAS